MRRLFLPVLACFLICFADADRALSKGGPGRGNGGGGGGGGGRSTTQRGSGGGRQTVTRQNGGGGNRPTLDTQSRGGGNRPTLDTQSRGNGNRPTLDTQSRGGGNRPTLDTQSRGNGNRPTLDTQSRGNGNRPTLDTQSRGNGPTIDRETHGNGNRPTSTARPEQGGGATGGSGQGRESDVTAQTDATDTTQRLTGRDNALNVRQSNEERIRDHRYQVADQLEANADRNGNENLRDVADRMRQRADEQYERRMSRITGEVPDDGLVDDPANVVDGLGDDVTGIGDGLVNDATEGVSDGLADVVDGNAGEQLLQSAGDQLLDSTPLDSDLADALDGTGDTVSQVLTREDRKLQHQLDIADHLRSIAERNGNDNLLRTADRMEDMAYSRYDRQIAKFLDPLTDSDPLLTDPLITDPLIDPLITDPLLTDPVVSDPTPDTLIEALEALTTP